MESELKECRNKRCRRHKVLVANAGRYCTACGKQMHQYAASPQPGMMEQPPLIEIPANGRYHNTARLPDMEMLPPTFPTAISVVPRQPKVSDTFTCNPDIEGCPIAVRPKVEIPLALFNDWVFLCSEFKTEWVAYLRGERRMEGERLVWTITGMYFPEQTVTSAHCEPVMAPDAILPDTIGTVHSHVAMKAVFSGEDREHFNHPVEIVVNRFGEASANLRQQLQCGKWQRGEGELVVVNCERELTLAQQLREKLREPVATPIFTANDHEVRAVDHQDKYHYRDQLETLRNLYENGDYRDW